MATGQGRVEGRLATILTAGMGRREFMALLGGVATAWPVVAQTQQPKLPIVGVLGSATSSTQGQWYERFESRLRELGWIKGRNVAIEYRWAEGRVERYAEIANEFVRMRVSVIVTSGTAAVAAAKQATSVIPIVFAAAGDPVGTGLVASLARPSGNATGLSLQQTDLAAKRLELLREMLPGLRRLVILANTGSAGAVMDVREAEATSRSLGIDASTVEIRSTKDIAPAFETFKGHAHAIYVVTDPLVSAERIRINTLALDARLPTMHSVRDYVATGGLISYGPSFADMYQHSADYVDKILRGVNPGEIPVEQPTKFELVINLKTAKALGLTVPSTLLARADEVIE